MENGTRDQHLSVSITWLCRTRVLKQKRLNIGPSSERGEDDLGSQLPPRNLHPGEGNPRISRRVRDDFPPPARSTTLGRTVLLRSRATAIAEKKRWRPHADKTDVYINAGEIGMSKLLLVSVKTSCTRSAWKDSYYLSESRVNFFFNMIWFVL